MSKRVLIISRFFPPEPGAGQERVRAIAVGLAEAGFGVHVVTAHHSYPMYKKREGNWTHPLFDIIRIWIPLFGRKFRLCSDLYFSLRAGISVLIRPMDLLFVSSPPFFVCMVACLVGTIRRVPYIIDVRDLYPETLVHLGAISHQGIIHRILRSMMKRWYRRAARVIVISEQMKQEVMETYGIEHVVVSYNGIDTRDELHKEHSTVLADIPKDKPIAIYVGNFGRVYDFEFLFQVIEQMPDWRFVFLGDGGQRAYLKKMALRYPSVHILSSCPSDELHGALRLCTVGIIALQDIPLAQAAIPTKVFDYAFAGLPTVGKVYGEATSYYGDWLVVAENVQDMVSAIRSAQAPQTALPIYMTRAKQVEVIVQEVKQIV
jgi:glycosyltransferase involved in cell wall biosynthesis